MSWYRPARVHLVASLLLVAALLVGCGGGGAPARRAWRTAAPPPPTASPVASITELSSEEILSRAIKATQEAGSVRVTGELRSDDETFTLDLRYDATGGGGRVTTDTQTVNVIRIQREVWFSGDEEFWRRVGGRDAVADYRDKYLKIPASDSRFAPLLNTTYVGKLIQILLRSKAPLAKGATVVLRGQRAIILEDRTKNIGGRVWVAADGQPYLLRMQAAEDSSGSGAVDFTEYNRRLALSPPDPRRVIDADDLAEPS